jgi:hypothetical protein
MEDPTGKANRGALGLDSTVAYYCNVAALRSSVYEFLGAEGTGYVVHLPVQDKTGYLLKRPVPAGVVVLTSMRKVLIKIGAKVISHGRWRWDRKDRRQWERRVSTQTKRSISASQRSQRAGWTLANARVTRFTLCPRCGSGDPGPGTRPELGEYRFGFASGFAGRQPGLTKTVC